MNNIFEGSVVICGSGQSGSIIQMDSKNVWVLLKNSNIWIGPMHQVRLPQDQEDLDSCPLEVERIPNKIAY